MPFVALARFGCDEVLEMGRERWAAIRSARPDLAPALDLQERLLTIVVSLMQTIDQSRLPRLSLPAKYAAAKLGRGVPLLAGEPIPLPVPVLKASLVELCDALAAGGAGESAEHIRAAIEGGTMDAGSLLTASLSRDQGTIRTGAVHRGLAPDLVWLVAELAVGPFAYALQRLLLADPTDKTLMTACDEWNRGYCPACGSWPALAEFAGGQRVMRCSFCAAGWDPGTYGCIYCGERAKPFVTAAPDLEKTNRRVEICATCAGYLKTVDVPELTPFPLIAIADLETMDLDLAAMERGYRRPNLKEFKQGS